MYEVVEYSIAYIHMNVSGWLVCTLVVIDIHWADLHIFTGRLHSLLRGNCASYFASTARSNLLVQRSVTSKPRHPLHCVYSARLIHQLNLGVYTSTLLGYTQWYANRYLAILIKVDTVYLNSTTKVMPILNLITYLIKTVPFWLKWFCLCH